MKIIGIDLGKLHDPTAIAVMESNWTLSRAARVPLGTSLVSDN